MKSSSDYCFWGKKEGVEYPSGSLKVMIMIMSVDPFILYQNIRIGKEEEREREMMMKKELESTIHLLNEND